MRGSVDDPLSSVAYSCAGATMVTRACSSPAPMPWSGMTRPPGLTGHPHQAALGLEADVGARGHEPAWSPLASIHLAPLRPAPAEATSPSRIVKRAPHPFRRQRERVDRDAGGIEDRVADGGGDPVDGDLAHGLGTERP